MKKHLLLATAISATCMCQPAFAQAATTPQAAPTEATVESPEGTAANAPAAGIGDIVVTAERRPNLAQRTPIAMTLVTGPVLAANGVNDVNQLPNIAPTVNIGMALGSTLITIRGVSSRDYTETGDPAVAISIDGFYLQRSVGLDAAFFDLDRVEVLNGPQGTLYGRNAVAGAVNIITAKPIDKFAMSASAEVGNYGEMILNGMVNLPVTDTLAVRIAGTHQSHDGYIKDYPETKGDDQDNNAARVTVSWKPTNRLTALATGEYIHEDGVGAVGVYLPRSDVGADGVLDLNPRANYSLNTRGYTDIDTKAARWNFSYDFDFATLTYLGGYQSTIFHRDNDNGGSNLFTYSFQQNENITTQNEELRLASNGHGPFKWQLGLYYFDESDNLLTYYQDAPNGALTNLYTFDYNVFSKSKAAFGQASYNLTDAIKIEGGIRYTQDNKGQIGHNILLGTYEALDNRYSGHKVTYHAAIDWQAARDNLLYAKFDTGYKAGGYTTDAAFNPETITAYEVGSKNKFLDRRIELNLSAYYYDYKGLQEQLNNPVTQISEIVNAGSAKVYGGEIEAIFLVTPDDRLNVNVAYNHARFGQLEAQGYDGSNQELSGDTLPQAPKWSLSGGLQHDFHLANATLSARAQTRYQSKSYFDIFNTPNVEQRSYTKTDLYLTYTPENGHWSAGLFVRNLENSVILTGAGVSTTPVGYDVMFGDPRTYGGRLTFNW